MRARALFVALLAALLGGAVPARAQLSPGPLASAHEAFDNPTRCFQCHPRGGQGSMDERCLACHKEVDWMKTRGRGFHARDGKGACAKCHPDHGGRGFALVKWDEGAPERFDHARTGYPLAGKHAELACAKCHLPKFQRSAAVAFIQKKDHATSWLGLETDCASCHADPHRGQLGTRCTQCHNERAWKPALGFDHARTAYPLTGKHVPLACEKCHLMPQFTSARDEKGAPVPQWKPLPFKDCTPCHKDPHNGRFQKNCSSCHRTESFASIDPRGFDHEKTRYPLRGKHVAVACAKCHDPKTAWGQKPKFAACADCHKDQHAGTATLAGKVVDCASCHGVEGFDRPAYTVAMHQGSAYPLAGRHVTVDCDKCHGRQPAGSEARFGAARVLMRPAHARCTDCHLDPHGGRFAAGGARARAKDCLACHTAAAFRPSQFDIAVHAQTTFPLAGAHRATPCVACHQELKAAPSTSTLLAAAKSARPLRFAESRSACVECHADPHAGQFAKRKDKGACQGCHTDEHFAPADRFSHDRDSAFKLEGAHARVACAACHRPERRGDATFVPYQGVPTRCEACHAPGIAPLKTTSLRDASLPPWGVFTLLTSREVRHAAWLH